MYRMLRKVGQVCGLYWSILQIYGLPENWSFVVFTFFFCSWKHEENVGVGTFYYISLITFFTIIDSYNWVNFYKFLLFLWGRRILLLDLYKYFNIFRSVPVMISSKLSWLEITWSLICCNTKMIKWIFYFKKCITYIKKSNFAQNSKQPKADITI